MKVKVLTPLQHDADSYQEGDIATLPDAAALKLIAIGAVEPFDVAKARDKAQASANPENEV